MKPTTKKEIATDLVQELAVLILNEEPALLAHALRELARALEEDAPGSRQMKQAIPALVHVAILLEQP